LKIMLATLLIMSIIAARIISTAIKVNHSIVLSFSIDNVKPVVNQKIMLVNVSVFFVGSALSANLRINKRI